MLHIKGITKLHEIKGFFTQPEKAGDTLLNISEKFITPKLKNKLDTLKKRGYFATQ